MLKNAEQAGVRSMRHPWIRRAAAAGYAARGLVYATVGLLSLRLALGLGGRTTDSRGAIATLGEGAFGKALVVVLAAGLAALALWMLADALFDPKGTRRSGLFAAVSRIAQGVASAGYVALGYAALRVALGDGRVRSGDAAAESWTARALQLPAGRWLVLVAAVIAAVVGARQIWRGLGARFLENLDLSSAGPRLRRWAVRLGKAGLSAQGVVFVLVGLFFAVAGAQGDPSEAAGFDGALAAIARQPAGTALLGVVALGLLAYAGFSVIEGRHQRVRGR